VLWPARMLRGRPLGWIVDVNPLYHLLEVIRQPLLSARAAGVENYALGLVMVACLGALAAGVLALYSRHVVYLL
jgi:homopolymeric O-antigen transport system permease protein